MRGGMGPLGAVSIWSWVSLSCWSRQPNGLRKEGPNPEQKIVTTFGRFRIHGNTDIFSGGHGSFLQTIFSTGLPTDNFSLYFSGARDTRRGEGDRRGPDGQEEQ
jgi:hypothetical protein